MTQTVVGLLAGFGLLALSGCAQMGGGGSSDAVESAAPATATVYTSKAGLSSQQRLREALELLEQGNEAAARGEVMLYLQQQPRSELGRDLLQQINTPAGEYFPQDYREVALASGQSLSNVAHDYLGSVYKFHALAKYNGIAEPRKLVAGQTIRIPLTSEALAAFAAMNGEHVNASETAMDDAGEPPVVEVSGGAALELPAVEVEELSEVEVAVVPLLDLHKMHREALNAYRAQDLNKAIDLWNQVLAADPDYENASLYRAQALQLQNKLRNLQ